MDKNMTQLQEDHKVLQDKCIIFLEVIKYMHQEHSQKFQCQQSMMHHQSLDQMTLNMPQQKDQRQLQEKEVIWLQLLQSKQKSQLDQDQQAQPLLRL